MQKERGIASTALLTGKRSLESQLVQLGVMMINYLKIQSIVQTFLTITLPLRGPDSHQVFQIAINYSRIIYQK